MPSPNSAQPRLHALLLLAFLLLCVNPLARAAPTYEVHYRIGFAPDTGEAIASMRIRPGEGRPQRLRFTLDPARHHGFEADGRFELDEAQATWHPPRAGGSLSWRYKVDRRRNSGGYDARITDRFALLRIDRLIPPVAVLARDGAESIATLRFDLPAGWNAAEVAYPFDADAGVYRIDTPGRRFNRPLGWMIAGDLGVRRDDVDGMEVVVAAARGESMRRNDILAIINATAAEMRDAFGTLPPKLLIVGGGDPLWRGGLSGPNSLYIHADRPMISENGSSTLLHEIVHVVTRIRGARNDDWIAEGIATYYSIELLRRTGLLAESRAERTWQWMANHGRGVRRLHARHSTGQRTARAVALFKQLDDEIRQATQQERDLDDLVRRFVGAGRVSTTELRAAAEEVIGAPSRVLRAAVLDP